MDSTYIMILNNKSIPPTIHLHVGIFVEVLWRDLGCFKICWVGLGSSRHHRSWFVVRIYHPETWESLGRCYGAAVCFGLYCRPDILEYNERWAQPLSAAHLKQQHRFPGSHSCLTVLEKDTPVRMNCRGCMYSHLKSQQRYTHPFCSSWIKTFQTSLQFRRLLVKSQYSFKWHY